MSDFSTIYSLPQRKCDQYWPERGMKNYGPIQVTLKETLNMSHYTLRKFIITHKLVSCLMLLGF